MIMRLEYLFELTIELTFSESFHCAILSCVAISLSQILRKIFGTDSPENLMNKTFSYNYSR